MHEEQKAEQKLTASPANAEALSAATLAQLSAAQELALEKLAAGISINKAALAAGVDRRTVYRWINTDPHFAAAFNTWRAEVVVSNRARSLALSDLALDTVTTAMEKGNARVALQVAKVTGALKPDRPGPTDPAELRRRRDLREGRQEMALAKAEQEFRKASGKDDQDHYHDVAWLETYIDSLLDLRAHALREETPEARAARLSPDSKSDAPECPETHRLLALVDSAAADKALPALIQSDSPHPSGQGSLPAPDSHPPHVHAQASDSAPAAPPSSPLAPPSQSSDPSRSPTIKTSAVPAPAHPPAPPEPRRRRPLSPFYTSNDSDDEVADPAWTRLI